MPKKVGGALEDRNGEATYARLRVRRSEPSSGQSVCSVRWVRAEIGPAPSIGRAYGWRAIHICEVTCPAAFHGRSPNSAHIPLSDARRRNRFRRHEPEAHLAISTIRRNVSVIATQECRQSASGDCDDQIFFRVCRSCDGTCRGQPRSVNGLFVIVRCIRRRCHFKPRRNVALCLRQGLIEHFELLR